MSTFYVVLYVFLAIIVLLCIISFVMYLMHLCSKEKDYDEENFFSPREASATANLNSTETTTFMEDSTANEETVQLLNVKQRTQQYEQQTGQARETSVSPPVPSKPPVAPRPASIHKPLLPVKPTTQSLQNSTVIKPANQPPPPPPTAQVEVAVVHPNALIQKTYSIKKPKAPPPPPPENTESIYENKPKRTAPTPPTYQDVMNDIPVDNYLSDND